MCLVLFGGVEGLGDGVKALECGLVGWEVVACSD